MIVQREIENIAIAELLQKIDESDLENILNQYIKNLKPKLLQVGKRKPFKPFKAVKMTGNGPTASEMVLNDRL